MSGGGSPSGVAGLNAGGTGGVAQGGGGGSTALGSAGLTGATPGGTGGTTIGGAGGIAQGGSAGNTSGSSAGLSGGGTGGTAQGGAAQGGTAQGGMDAGGADAGTMAPCITAGTELCEDFESGVIDPQKWTINKPSADAQVNVDGTRVHSGSFALHIQVVPGEQSTAQLRETVTFPAENDAFYARAFINLSPDLPSDNNGGFHMGYIQAEGDNTFGRVRMALGSAGEKSFLGYSIYFGPPFDEFGPRSPLSVTPNRWLCLELYSSGSGGTDSERRVWVDDMELTEQHSTYNGQPPPAFDQLAIGMWQYHPTPTVSDMWVDDIRVSHQRIGCSAP